MMKTVTDMILKMMENQSSASVSFDDVSGIVVKPTVFEPIHFMFAKEFNVSMKKKDQIKIYIYYISKYTRYIYPKYTVVLKSL